MIQTSNELQKYISSLPKAIKQSIPYLGIAFGTILTLTVWHYLKVPEIVTDNNTTTFNLFDYVQPSLLIIAAFSSIVGSVMLLNKQKYGWHFIWTALNLLYAVFFIRFVILILDIIHGISRQTDTWAKVDVGAVDVSIVGTLLIILLISVSRKLRKNSK